MGEHSSFELFPLELVIFPTVFSKIIERDLGTGEDRLCATGGVLFAGGVGLYEGFGARSLRGIGSPLSSTPTSTPLALICVGGELGLRNDT